MSTGRGPRRGLLLAIEPSHQSLPRLAGLACALALTALVTGNVAAFQLNRDDNRKVELVTPRRPAPIVSGQWLRLKLATPAGRRALELG